MCTFPILNKSNKSSHKGNRNKRSKEIASQDELIRTPQQLFLKNVQTLKDLLIQDNYTNIKNLNLANHNFNQIFSYLKGVIRSLTIKNQKLNERVRELMQQLYKYDRDNQVLLKFQQDEPLINLGQSQYKLSNFVPLASKVAQGFTTKYVPPTSIRRMSHQVGNTRGKIDIRFETLEVQKFITKQLGNSIIQDQSKQFKLPKEVILNLYVRWNQMQNRPIPPEWRPFVKSLITNEIKRLFPNVDHNERYYRGITFRKDLLPTSQTKEQQAQLRQKQQIKDIGDELFFLDDYSIDLSFP